jgi:hypothetical protein
LAIAGKAGQQLHDPTKRGDIWQFLISLDEKCCSRALDDFGILQMCDDRTARLRAAEGLSFEPDTLQRH